MSEKYERNVYLAMLAEQCNRFEDMMDFLEEMVGLKKDDLSSDERNLLSIAYKNTISKDRSSLRTLHAYEAKERKKEDSPYLQYILEYKKKIEAELVQLCTKIIGNIEKNLLTKAADAEARVFYYKMIADYYRYAAENVEGDDKKKFADNSLEAYETATKHAGELTLSNPIRLGLALNLSVFHYEVRNDSEKACAIAKETLDNAKKELSGVDEDDEVYRDAFSIINLLQENLSMWTVEADN